MSFVDGAGLLQWTVRTGEETLAFLEQNIRAEPGDPYCSFESILQILKPFPLPRPAGMLQWIMQVPLWHQKAAWFVTLPPFPFPFPPP